MSDAPEYRVFDALMSPADLASLRAGLEDFGFADMSGAAIIAARRAARRRLVRQTALRQATSSKLFDVHIEKDGRPRVLPGEQIPPITRYHQSVIAQCAIERIRCDDVSHHELMQAVKSILEFVELVLSDFGHDGDSAVDVRRDGTGEPEAPHRFDGAAK